MKKILFYLLTMLFVIQGCQSSYEILSLENEIDFIIPPGNDLNINLDKNNIYEINEHQKYFYIYIDGLFGVKNYDDAINLVNHAEYFVSGIRIENFCKDPRLIDCSQSLTTNMFNKIAYDWNNNRILIQIEYKKLLRDKTNIIASFYSLANELLLNLFEKEISPDKGWPTSISQSIVEKIFELIPIPQEASLARYGIIKSDKYFVLLLNPKFQLEIDSISKTLNPLDKRSFLMKWEGTKSFSFYRDKSAKLKQNPYLGLDNSFLPTNKIGSSNHKDKIGNSVLVTYYNLAGSSDIELSSKISSVKIIALFQPILKSNNTSEGLPDADLNSCCVTKYDCNSQIVLSDDLSSILEPKKLCDNDLPIYKDVGVFGERNFIKAFIMIYIDNTQVNVPFGTTSEQLEIKSYISKQYDVYRLFYGKYVKIKRDNQSVTLLPSDYIITK